VTPLNATDLFGARLASSRSAIGLVKDPTAISRGLLRPEQNRGTRNDTGGIQGARLVEVNTGEIAMVILEYTNAHPAPIHKALPLKVVVEKGTLDPDFIALVKAVSDKNLILYYSEADAKLARMAEEAKAALNKASLEWLAANVVPVKEGEILPQLKQISSFDQNARVLFIADDSKNFVNSIEKTQAHGATDRFIVAPENLSAKTRPTPQEYFAVLYVADSEKVLTALGKETDYQDPAILQIFRKGWAKFIAIPIKILEELRRAIASLQATSAAA